MDFLQNDLLEWEDDNSFQMGLEIIKQLQVVNDIAERGVKLMEDYNKILSRSEEEKQCILQIVSEYRKKYPLICKTPYLVSKIYFETIIVFLFIYFYVNAKFLLDIYI